MDAGSYAKSRFRSIRGEEPLIRPARTYFERYTPRAARAMAQIPGPIAIDVNPCVNTTTGKMDSQKWSSAARRRLGRWHVLPRLDKIKMLAHHAWTVRRFH
jgi:hypothetical protein